MSIFGKKLSKLSNLDVSQSTVVLFAYPELFFRIQILLKVSVPTGFRSTTLLIGMFISALLDFVN